MSVENLTQKLAALQETWDKAEIAGVVPDDDYEFEVDDIDFFESKDGSALYLKIVYKVATGDYAGQTVDWIGALDHPERLSFTKEHLAILGLPVDSLSMGDLIPELAKVGGQRVRASVVTTSKNGRTYTNLYLRERLGNVPETDVPADMTDLPPVQDSLPGDEKINF